LGFKLSPPFQQEFSSHDLRFNGFTDKLARRGIASFGDPLEAVPPMGRQQEREVDCIVARHGCSFQIFKYVEVQISFVLYEGVTGR